MVQVQGCYWHGCPCLGNKPRVAYQRRARQRDEPFRTYCRGKGRRLFEVWEHDIRAGNVTVLVEATARIRQAEGS